MELRFNSVLFMNSTIGKKYEKVFNISFKFKSNFEINNKNIISIRKIFLHKKIISFYLIMKKNKFLNLISKSLVIK